MEHSPDKEKGAEREKYKKWFKKHKKIFEKTKIMKYWIKENEEQVLGLPTYEIKERKKTAGLPAGYSMSEYSYLRSLS